LCAVATDTSAGVLAVGTYDAVGCVVRVSPQGLGVVVTPHAHCAIAFRPNGIALACGPKGALASIRGSLVATVMPPSDANLRAIGCSGDTGIAAGDGGRAVRVDKTLGTAFEPLPTSSSIVKIHSAGDILYAGTNRGRILRRTREGHWARLSPEWGDEPQIIAVWGDDKRVRALTVRGDILALFRHEER
jgi:hypothetical protein